MEGEYPIVPVAHRGRPQREPLGSKEKFWVPGPGGHKWLFKLPKKSTGGHWAEKIAYEVARRSGIHAAKVELAECEVEGRVEKGSISRSFTMEYELYHGNQILAGMDPDYASDKKYKQNQHTESGSRGPSPLELIGWCMASSTYQAFFRGACRRVAGLSASVISRAVTRVPSGWMTQTSKEFAIGLLRYNHGRIKRITG